jgi:hypothetical protein
MSEEFVKCPVCGFPLYQGNMKREKRAGKRTRLIHRVCPTEKGKPAGYTKEEITRELEAAPTPAAFIVKLDELNKGTKNAEYTPITRTLLEESYLDVCQRVAEQRIQQTGVPYRFFIRKGDIERIRTAAGKGVNIKVEVFSVHEDMYEATPDSFEDFTEIKTEGE